MVDSVVSFVVDRLGDILIEQVVFFRGVRDDVEWLRGQLQYMLCFLKDAEEKQDIDNRMHKWIKDIRDVAYEAEDIMDNFILKVEAGTPKKMGLKDCFEKYFCICSKHASLIQQANLYGIGQEINKLKTKLTQIEQSRVTFGIRSIDDTREGSYRMNRIENMLRKERPYKDNEHVVGFKEDANKLTYELMKKVKDRYMISIVGTGGLGKTTIARKLCNNLSRAQEFDCYGWVSVSADYEIQDLLRSTIKSFKRPTTKVELEFIENMKEEDLEPHLRDYLKGHRYLMVLDDVWDVNAWPSLMRAFPDENNGSRVIMTTRNKVVAQASNERIYVHELPFLNDEESWELFCRKAFPNYDNEVGDEKSHCPPCLESLAREMVGKCRGLPLAIVVLGGLLRRKDPDEWPKFKEHMWRHVREDDSHRVPVQHILALSFNDLPYRLKSCFLYLGLFPEDFEIDAQKLCRLWEAEGFIKLGKESFEEEEEAEEYLRELIDRSLIQVGKRNWKRIIKCRVHDLLRDFAIEKSKELNFLQIYGGRLAPNSRRLAFNGVLQRFVSLDSSDMHLRTLLFFNLENEDSKTAELQSLCRKLRLLRVLDLQHFQRDYNEVREKQRLPDEIGKLIHLRYLGLCGTNISPLSQFIGNLHALQTLELGENRHNDPIQLPNEICEAKQLRHLLGLFKWPFRVDNMKNLRTLQKVLIEDQMEFNPMDMINLRELHVLFFRKDKNSCTLDSIGGLRSLQSLQLEVSVEDINQIPEVHLHPLSHCKSLLQLRLRGWHGKSSYPDWKFSIDWKLSNLKFLILFPSCVTEDPMPMLEKIPKLTVLKLVGYRQKKLVCTAGGFPQLEILQLKNCEVDEFQVEGGAMPVLKSLSLENGGVSLPDRLRSIPAPDPPLDPYLWLF
ncbi:disease resistance protein RPP13-like [Rhododendron vialii]|uniref:disease resistance protein RPP13-like n=1 Tax=Rhododendron vialii TaxID=182163 RepID=UPI00265DE5FD|nr:disease resistance protein RPP13-like [Rhododendron vialii]